MADGILFRVIGAIVIIVIVADRYGGRNADTHGFMMGSPNATVYRLRGVGLILDDLARVGCSGGAANVNPLRAGGRPAGADAGGGGEGAGMPAMDTGREHTAPVLATPIQSCSLLLIIEVVKAHLGRLRRCVVNPLGTAVVIVVVPCGWPREE
jgi:hypothetical protein